MASALDLIVHLDRLPDGRRVVSQIAEVTGVHPETTEVLVVDLFQPPQRAYARADRPPAVVHRFVVDQEGLAGTGVPVRPLGTANGLERPPETVAMDSDGLDLLSGDGVVRGRRGYFGALGFTDWSTGSNGT
jgi:hypothetical protein